LTPHSAVQYKGIVREGGGVLVIRSVLALAALLAAGSTVQAADPGTPTLPTLALDPQAPPPSLWKGLYTGADIFFSGGRGSKGLVGGGAFVGYDRHLDNNLVLGVQASVGYAPFSLQHSPFKGYDYGELSAKVGYEMGRFTPYVTTGIALTKPNANPGEGYFSAADSANNLFNGATNLSATGVFGAGVDYALTNNTTIGIGAVVGTGRGFVAPP
jgi:opacity protein-like surface antigen